MPPSVVLAFALLCAGPAAADPLLQAPPMAEAWVTADRPEILRAAESAGAVFAEGRRVGASGVTQYRMLLSASTRDELVAAGIAVEVERDDHARGAPRDGYHAHEEGELLMRAIADAHARSGLVQLGLSVEGRTILALWMGQPPDTGAPAVRVLAAHHGDEWSSFEGALDTAVTLSERDGSDVAVTALLDSSTVWIVPYVNPDGVEQGARFNVNFVDLNRNYDYEWTAGGFAPGDAPFSEPETRAQRTLALSTLPHASLSLHAGATNIGWVWNYTTDPHSDWPQLESMALDFASVNTTPTFWVTNGASWYVTHGDTNDWSYGRYGGLDFTVEMTTDKDPPAGEIPDFLDDHRESIIAFLTRPPDVRGTVTDALTGEPVAATVELLGDADPIGRPIFSDPTAGRFYRIVDPMPLTLRVSAPGYTGVEVPATADTAVALQRDGLVGGRPDSFLVSELTAVRLPEVDEDGVLTLRQNGVPDATFAVVAGVAEVDPADVAAPGLYSLLLDDGRTWNRALLIGDTQGAVTVTSAAVDGDALGLEGAGFAVGARAFALSGDVRALQPLTVLDETPTTLQIDISTLPIDESADVYIIVNGTQIGVGDVRQGTEVDTGVPPDTGPPDSGDDTAPPDTGEPVARSCSCSEGPHPTSVLWPWLLLAAARRRNRT